MTPSSPKTKSPLQYHYLPRVDFDEYKDRYQSEIQKSISFIGQSHDFFTRVKVRYFLEILGRHFRDISKLRVLDVGCGVGITDRFLISSFQKLFGVDVGKGIIKRAAQFNPKASYQVYNGKKLPFKDGSMDVTFAICVLHHIPPENLDLVVSEMKRVTKKGGLIAIFEHNPLNPLTLRAVNHCDLDEDAILLSMGKTEEILSRNGIKPVEKRFILFTPFKGDFFYGLEHWLGWLPLGAQYFIAGKK